MDNCFRQVPNSSSSITIWLTQLPFRIEIILPALLGCTCFATHVVQADSKQPNIIVFLTDDLGQLDSTPYGATDIRTPNMQRLSESGKTFDHAYVASPSCAPSRSALLTGLMPARNGAEANHSYKRDGVASLPEELRKLGYQTAAFGKVAHGANDISRHGFEKFDDKHDAGFVEKFLRERDVSKPLCLFVGTHEPHVPWLRNAGYELAQVKLPPSFIDTPETRDFRDRYYTDVTDADRRLGELMELSRTYLDAESTLMLLSSDHGAQWPFGKWNLYDAGIRVPLIASWPGVIQPNTRTNAMVQWIDLLPTLIDAAGGKAVESIDGRSFLPVLRGETPNHRDAIFTTHSGDGKMNVYPIRSIRTSDWKLIVNLHPEFSHTTHIDKALAKDGGRYWISWFEKTNSDPSAATIVMRYHKRPAVELYDLSKDPYELNNLANDSGQADRVKELRSRLEAWMQRQGDQQTVFNEPRLLTDPKSTRPGENAGNDTVPTKPPIKDK